MKPTVNINCDLNCPELTKQSSFNEHIDSEIDNKISKAIGRVLQIPTEERYFIFPPKIERTVSVLNKDPHLLKRSQSSLGNLS